MSAETRQSLTEMRTRRLETAIAHARMALDIMPTVMRSVEFRSRLNPPLGEHENRETIQHLIETMKELEDSASAFLCFCDCKYGPEAA